MRNNCLPIFVLTVSFFQFQCSKKPETLFVLKDAADTGVDFVNTVTESDSFNILSYEYIYNGGGVGIADFNNDGLQDIFFTGNQVPNKLYLNQGDFEFKDISAQAHVNVDRRWNEGVAVVDINNDGWMDVYVCATTYPDAADRKNMLFVNQGLNASGEPTFKEMAGDYKIDFDGHSVMAAFFDYDRDGDLDLYILVNQKLDNVPTNYRPRISDGSAANNDRLYRNEGDGTFKDVSTEAGIVYEGFGLGLAVTDVNSDGWPDLYVSNDYLSNDILYLNNGDGTFTNGSAAWVGHQSQFSMGNDAADVNNDALPDIMTLDMLPETNARKKTTIGNKSYLTYINNEKFGYEYQFTRNMLQLNNGLGQGIKFSEVGQLSGIYQTEWSWSPLFADFDNDGFKDVLITNGFPKDITDKDFANYRADVGNIASNRHLIDSIPVIKIPNYAYRSNGDLTFTDVTKIWGMDIPSFSNGAAFADLDNDGDLDYVVNNINDKAFVYENTLYSHLKSKDAAKANFLRIKLKGTPNNLQAIGAKVWLYADSGKVQFVEQYVYRGFLSSVESISHFGLGAVSVVDSIVVQWPNGARQKLEQVPANQVLSIAYTGGAENLSPAAIPRSQSLFVEAHQKFNILFRHREEDKIDFNQQRTLPHKFSQSGPALSAGDINGDGLEDLIVGGSTQFDPTLFFQQPNGTFVRKAKENKNEGKIWEDEGLLLFDADGDGDLDLYVVSGSLESQDPQGYQDRLYINNGRGDFTLNPKALPSITASGSCVRAGDFDADGDLDLFVGGRVVPGAYPMPAESYLLRNDKGSFTNVTSEVSPSLSTLGMVTDAIWSDFNNDGRVDLVVVGEFMPITFFTNVDGKLVPLASSGLQEATGWWNSIVGGDFDNDGDIDYVAGNLGLNNSYQVQKDRPLKVIAKDFDGNGSIDPVLACYMRESMDSDVKKLYPVHFWDELNSQSPKFRNKYSRYRQYSKVTMDQVFTPEDLKDALVLEANHMTSSYVENLGGGKFAITPLPTLAQLSPIFGMVPEDVNGDGNLDVILTGNDYGNEVFAGRFDALNGLILLGDGKGAFHPMSTVHSGFYVRGDAKALVRMESATGSEIYLASQNKDSLVVFEHRQLDPSRVVHILPHDVWAEISYADGRKRKTEFYHGAGYLSQSSRQLRVSSTVLEVTIHDDGGGSRKETLQLP